MAKRRTRRPPDDERPTVHFLVGTIDEDGYVSVFRQMATDDDPEYLAALRAGGFALIADPLDEAAADLADTYAAEVHRWATGARRSS